MILLVKKMHSLNYKKFVHKLYTFNNYNKKNVVYKEKYKIPNIIRIFNLSVDKINIKSYPCLFLKINRVKDLKWNKIILLRNQSNVWISCSFDSPWFYFN